ncbi:redoxin domain-containing protein [Canibacter zhoujuaniae]|uniref:redoxin domain-containing protein n=1 Tax=Canibacter zhoujuaniae TaxID=2708343 RepID=UPI0014249C19|nr:redoxin domain-containing protein [Canibacter zhoujuaniae]
MFRQKFAGRIGEHLPRFTLPSATGAPSPLGTSRNGAEVGDDPKAVFLVFIPRAFTPVCAQELQELTAHQPEFLERGVRLQVVTCDEIEVLASWAAQHGVRDSVDFELLSDAKPRGRVARKFAAYNPVAKHATRTTVLVVGDGEIIDRFSSAPSRAREITRYFKALELLSTRRK